LFEGQTHLVIGVKEGRDQLGRFLYRRQDVASADQPLRLEGVRVARNIASRVKCLGGDEVDELLLDRPGFDERRGVQVNSFELRQPADLRFQLAVFRQYKEPQRARRVCRSASPSVEQPQLD
jgi:hypothetical protein